MIVLGFCSGFSLPITQAEGAVPSVPLGTLPLRVDGSATYPFEVESGVYYLGMAVVERGSPVIANLTQDSTFIVGKQVSYWGARQVQLSGGHYELTLQGRGAAIIAADAQLRKPAVHAFAAISSASFFLWPPASQLEISVTLEGSEPVRMVVYDGLLHPAHDSLVSPGSEVTLQVSIPEDSSDFAYVVLTNDGHVVKGTLAWDYAQRSSARAEEPQPSAIVWVPLVGLAVLVAGIVLWRMRHPRFTRKRH